MRGDRKIWLVVLAAAVAYGVFALWLNPGLARDSITRYSVMAEEFAAGNFREAYHPGFCVFHQTAAGVLVWLLGISGLAACQIVATLGWCLAAVPLWHLVRRLFDEESAWWAVALMLTFPQFFMLAGDGMRDAVRVLAYALMAYGFLSSSFWLGVGLFVSVTLRVDGILAAGLLYALYTGWRLKSRDWKSLAWPTLLSLLGLLADSAAVWRVTGWFVPTGHFIKLVAKVTGGLP